jgi:ribosomal protein S18 acetylase RimI-like enzyme
MVRAAAAASDIVFRHAETHDDLVACHPVMLQLRPRLTDCAAFCAQIGRQQTAGYRLLAAWRGDVVMALAGYRELENTIYGRFIYVDDLVVAEDGRRDRLGAALLDQVATETRRRGCQHMVLDTGLANALAQRFYFRWGLLAKGMHFVWPVTPERVAR